MRSKIKNRTSSCYKVWFTLLHDKAVKLWFKKNCDRCVTLCIWSFLTLKYTVSGENFTMSCILSFTWRRSFRIGGDWVLVRILILKICDKRAHRGVKNALDLEDLQNTLDWSWSGYHYIYLESSQETLQVCPWNRLAFGTSRETLDTSRGCSNLAAG